MHAPKLLLLADRHTAIADKWDHKIKQAEIRSAKDKNVSPKHGIKNMAISINKPQAKSLGFIKQDEDTDDGGKKAAYISDPCLIDTIIRKNWQRIFDGNATDQSKPVDENCENAGGVFSRMGKLTLRTLMGRWSLRL